MFGDGCRASAKKIYREADGYEGRFLFAADLNKALEMNDWNRVRALLQSRFLVVSMEIRQVVGAICPSETKVPSQKFQWLNAVPCDERFLL